MSEKIDIESKVNNIAKAIQEHKGAFQLEDIEDYFREEGQYIELDTFTDGDAEVVLDGVWTLAELTFLVRILTAEANR